MPANQEDLAMIKATALLAASVVLAFSAPAFAEKMEFDVDLTGAQQVPPVETQGKGEIEGSYDTETHMLSWELEYEDLSSDVTAAHFHGPAAEGETAPPIIPAKELASGSEESVEITAEQAQMLMDGMLYFNVHTTNHKGGEIRGQVELDD